MRSKFVSLSAFLDNGESTEKVAMTDTDAKLPNAMFVLRTMDCVCDVHDVRQHLTTIV